jgi:trimeric autotransporter adhesin
MSREARNSTLIVLALAFTSLVHAQIRSATITGSVTDATGAVIPGADVVVTNQETGIGNNTRTTGAGQFTVPYLPAGTYTVSVSAAGFAPYRETGIALATSENRRIEAQLKVGTLDSAVEVTAQAARIQTESTTVQGAVQSEVIAAIPNISANPISYALLQAGVQPRNATADTTSSNSFGIGINGRRQYSAFGINGGRAFTNDILLDGLPVMGGGYNEAAVLPNTEGLQEVRVISNNFSAEYGHGQGVVSMSTKSGTNQYHGRATYLLRNEALNANTTSNNANNIARRPFKVHEYGGAVGGPILKDKLFFFSSYHFLMRNVGVSSLITVPTALERKGDFSQSFIRDTNGLPVPAMIFDPWTVTQLGADLYQRAPYPGAVIPNPDKYALSMLSYYPSPNRTPDDAFQTNNFQANTVQTFRRHSLNNRIDYRRGMHSLYGSGGVSYGTIWSPRAFGRSPFNGYPSLNSDKNPYGQIGDTIVLSPTLVLDVRYGLTRINTKSFSGKEEFTENDKDYFTDYDGFGVPKNVQALIQIYGAAPSVSPSAFGGGAGGNWTGLSGGGATKHERQISHGLTGSITKVRGRWSLKAGAEFRNVFSNYNDFEEASVLIPTTRFQTGGNFTFQYLTAAGAVASQNSTPVQKGFNGATLLTGTGTWFVMPGGNMRPALLQRYVALYSQNDWRASSKLTINLGLRWDLQPGPTERYNRMTAFDLTKNNPFGTKGVLAFPGFGGYGRGLWNTRYKDFGPRVGAAYQLSRTLVLRGGVGLTYLPSNTGYFSGPIDYGPTSFSSGVNILPYGLSPHGIPEGRFSDPPLIAVAAGSNPAAPQNYGFAQAFFDRDLKNGRALQWNFFVEKAFSGSWFASVGYSASHSTNLSNRGQPFQSLQSLSPSTLASWRDQYIASNGTLNPANQQVANPFQPTSGPLLPFVGALGGATIARYATLLPYPHLFAAETVSVRTSSLSDSSGFATYHSLQLRLSHAFSNGFQLDANYTWSKSLDYTNTAAEDTQGFNAGGTAAAPDLLNKYNNKKYSFSDIPHRFVGIAVYELPFGTGRPLEIRNRVVRSIVGRWQTGGVVTLQGGMPFVISGASDGASVTRPNPVAGVPVEVPKELQRWYDGTTSVTLPCGRVITPSKNTFLKYSSCGFAGQVVQAPNGKFVPDVYWVGRAAQTYGYLRTPGRFNIDVSIRRSFKIREGKDLEVSADATNLLNHPELSGTYTGALGNTNLVSNATKGLAPGMGSSDTYGTIGLSTFDPRQVTLHLQLRF